MFDFILSFLGLSGVGVGILAWFIGLPKILAILSTALDIVAPLLKGVTEGAVGIVKILINGLKDILDNIKTIATVLLLCTVSFGAGHFNTFVSPPNCDKVIQDLRKDYKFVKRKKSYKQPTNVLDNLFGIWK